jgi:hypothetical protein
VRFALSYRASSTNSGGAPGGAFETPNGTCADGTNLLQMAVLVKPNGLFGTAYMAAIRPFRHLIVYPPAMRQIEREWRARRAKGK